MKSKDLSLDVQVSAKNIGKTSTYENAGVPIMKPGKYECNRCNKVFTAASSLKRHMQLHTGQFSYYCETCRKPFNNNTNFNEHMRAHEGLTYQCQICCKTFTTKKAYSYHMSIHTGQYRFTCENCGKGFNVKPDFEKHLKSHNWYNIVDSSYQIAQHLDVVKSIKLHLS